MVIRYVHASNTKKEKTFDTVKAYRNQYWAFFRESGVTQEQYDKDELARFERDKQRGLIRSYKIVV